MFSVLIEAPVTTSIESMDEMLQSFIETIGGSWSWQGREVAGKRLIDCVYSSGKFNWQYLLPPEQRDSKFGSGGRHLAIDPQIEAWVASLGWRLVGAWRWDGSTQDKLVIDSSDPLNPVLTGEVINAVDRLYPAKTNDPATDPLFIDVMNYMDDDVTYDVNTGAELSRARPVAPREVNSWGWPPRT